MCGRERGMRAWYKRASAYAKGRVATVQRLPRSREIVRVMLRLSTVQCAATVAIVSSPARNESLPETHGRINLNKMALEHKSRE